MNSKERVTAIFNGQETDRPAVINPTSVLTAESLRALGLSCPAVHLEADKMAAAAAVGCELCGFESVMPKFGVVHSAAALGAEVDWHPGDNAMPVIRRHPISDPGQFKMPKDFLDRPEVKVVLDALRLLKRRYGDSIVIIGKVFGPWTTAYNLCGTGEFLIETALDPAKAAAYLEVFTPPGILFAEAQYEAGADMLLWGDHVSGDLCSPATYKELLLPIHQKINGSLLAKKGPVIMHACGKTLDRMRLIAQSGFECFHYDSRNDARAALAEVDGKILLTGGIDNTGVLLNGQPEDVREQALDLMEAGIPLISPECAISLKTPNRNLVELTRTVRELGDG